MKLSDTFSEAFKAGAKGVADSLFAPKSAAAPAAAPAVLAPIGIDSPTPSALPSWLFPAGIAAVGILLLSRR